MHSRDHILYTYIAYGTYYNQNVRLTPMQIQRKWENYKGMLKRANEELKLTFCWVNENMFSSMQSKKKWKKKNQNKQPTRKRGLFTDSLKVRKFTMPQPLIPLIHMYTVWIIHSELNGVYIYIAHSGTLSLD